MLGCPTGPFKSKGSLFNGRIRIQTNVDPGNSEPKDEESVNRHVG